MLRMTLMMTAMALPLAACSFGAPPPESAADRADLAACTQRADQINAARHYAYLSRTDQYATPFIGSPNPRYLSNKLAQIHDRQDRIDRCVHNSNPTYVGSGGALPEPTIIGPAP